MADHSSVEKVIDEQLKRPDLTSEDVLRLTIARRLNQCSDSTFRQILAGQVDAPKPSRGFLAELLDF